LSFVFREPRHLFRMKSWCVVVENKASLHAPRKEYSSEVSFWISGIIGSSPWHFRISESSSGVIGVWFTKGCGKVKNLGCWARRGGSVGRMDVIFGFDGMRSYGYLYLCAIIAKSLIYTKIVIAKVAFLGNKYKFSKLKGVFGCPLDILASRHLFLSEIKF
jgi:hypothetical protein